MKYRALFITLLAAVVLHLMTDIAGASCIGFTPDFERSLPFVVEGVFLDGPTAPHPSRRPLITPARFRVTKYLKGIGPGEIAISTNYNEQGDPLSGSVAPIQAEAGEHWRLYFSEEPTGLMGVACSAFKLGEHNAPPYPLPSTRDAAPWVVSGGLGLSMLVGWLVAKRSAHESSTD